MRVLSTLAALPVRQSPVPLLVAGSLALAVARCNVLRTNYRGGRVMGPSYDLSVAGNSDPNLPLGDGIFVKATRQIASLTAAGVGADTSAVAAHQRRGFDSPEKRRTSRQHLYCAAIFASVLHGTLYGRAVWEGRKTLPVPFPGLSTCTVPPTPFDSGVANLLSVKRSFAMTSLALGASAPSLFPVFQTEEARPCQS